MNTRANKIIVSQPIEIQRHVLKIAKEKTDEEIINVIKSIQNNKAQSRNRKNIEYLKVWHAYASGWRGNFAAIEPKMQDESKAIVSSVSVAIKDTESQEENKPQSSKSYEKPTDYEVANKFISLVSNASTRGKEFNLSLADVKRLLTKKRCEYTGIELTKATSTPPNPTDRTIDRLDSSLGYVQGNVFAVSHHANSLKNVLFEKESESKTTVEFIHEMTGRIIKLKSSKDAGESNE